MDQDATYVRCGQTAGWITLPLGREVGLGPGDFVLDGNPSPQERDTAPISAMSIVAKWSPISAVGELLYTNCWPNYLTKNARLRFVGPTVVAY